MTRIIAATALGVFAFIVTAGLFGHVPRWDLPARAPRQISRAQAWLIQSGSPLTSRQFVAASVGLGLGALGMLWLVVGVWWIAAFPAIGAMGGLWWWYERNRQRRLREVQEAWPDGIRTILAFIESGSTLRAAIEGLSQSGPLPLREAFNGWVERSRLLGVVATLETVREQLADPTSDRVIEVLIIAHDQGGDLVAVVLRDLVDEITLDLRTIETIRTAESEQRVESWLVVIVPWAVLVFLATVPPDYREFYRSPSGLLTVVLAAVWTAVGVLLLRFMGRKQREPRVLGGGALDERSSHAG